MENSLIARIRLDAAVVTRKPVAGRARTLRNRGSEGTATIARRGRTDLSFERCWEAPKRRTVEFSRVRSDLDIVETERVYFKFFNRLGNRNIFN